MGAANTYNFTTGPSSVPEITDDNGDVVGELSYNGCTFSPLFTTEVSGRAVPDEANRTIKYMEYTINVDGYVTLIDGTDDVHSNTNDMRRLLEQQGGVLIYKGRGMDLEVNTGRLYDVAWGPVPKVFEFQPLGAGRSAKVRWQVTVHISETDRQLTDLHAGEVGKGQLGGLASIPLLQFNYETVVSYNDDGYSSLSIRGTLEIGATRFPNQKTRTLRQTADDARTLLDERIMSGINLAQFYPTKRDFSLSRDKRTLEWSFQFEERAYQQYPPGCTVADGSYTLRPAKTGMGLCVWLCTLQATYTVRADQPRRVAWLAFLALLRLRMKSSEDQPPLPDIVNGNQNPNKGGAIGGALNQNAGQNDKDILKVMQNQLKKENNDIRQTKRAWLIDFNIDEGLYRSSKTVTFSATWRMVCTFSHVLLASGVWKKVFEQGFGGPKDNLWATEMKDVSGSQSWLQNRIDPNTDLIIDFGMD